MVSEKRGGISQRVGSGSPWIGKNVWLSMRIRKKTFLVKMLSFCKHGHNDKFLTLTIFETLDLHFLPPGAEYFLRAPDPSTFLVPDPHFILVFLIYHLFTQLPLYRFWTHNFHSSYLLIHSNTVNYLSIGYYLIENNFRFYIENVVTENLQNLICHISRYFYGILFHVHGLFPILHLLPPFSLALRVLLSSAWLQFCLCACFSFWRCFIDS